MVASDSIRIERIRADQGPVLRAIRLESLADAPTAFGQTIDEARAQSDAEWQRQARQSATGSSRTWLLAEHDGRAVGMVQGRRRQPATLLLFSMWIEPGMRHQGLGRALISNLETWGRDWGARETILWVYAGNVPAVGFYECLGFMRLASGEDHERGASLDAIAMRRGIEAI